MGCAFSVFVFCSFPASGRKGPGAGRILPEDRGSGWVVRMPGPGGPGMGRVGWIPGSPAGRDRGSEMNNKLPFVRFLPGNRVPDGDRTVPSGD
jgi:hypothetical protein